MPDAQAAPHQTGVVATKADRGSPAVADRDRMVRNVLAPSTQAALTATSYSQLLGNGDLELTIGTLRQLNADIAKGDLRRLEATLLMQAQTLDLVFHSLARRAEAADWMSTTETYLRLALKAQNQCRTTLQTLADIKNPPHVAFVRQANIANGPQQVNNGQRVDSFGPDRTNPDRSRENPPTKLLAKVTHGYSSVDSGAASPTGAADCVLAPLGAVDGAADAKR